MRKLSEMPKHYFVCGLDVEDANPPYLLAADSAISDEEKFELPEALAYYLRTHWGGTESMRKENAAAVRRNLQNKIKELLGIKD